MRSNKPHPDTQAVRIGDNRDNPEDQSAEITDGPATEGATQGLEEFQPGLCNWEEGVGNVFTMGLVGKSKLVWGYLRRLVGLCKTFYGMLEGNSGKV